MQTSFADMQKLRACETAAVKAEATKAREYELATQHLATIRDDVETAKAKAERAAGQLKEAFEDFERQREEDKKKAKAAAEEAAIGANPADAPPTATCNTAPSNDNTKK